MYAPSEISNLEFTIESWEHRVSVIDRLATLSTSPRRMFSGLMSLCMTCFLCKYASASAI